MLIYFLFMVELFRNDPIESLDEVIYWVNAISRVLEFLVALCVVAYGTWESLFGEWSWMGASVIIIHSYFNVWLRAQSGWKSFLLRQEAAKKINSLPRATAQQLEQHNDVCSVCFQVSHCRGWITTILEGCTDKDKFVGIVLKCSKNTNNATFFFCPETLIFFCLPIAEPFWVFCCGAHYESKCDLVLSKCKGLGSWSLTWVVLESFLGSFFFLPSTLSIINLGLQFTLHLVLGGRLHSLSLFLLILAAGVTGTWNFFSFNLYIYHLCKQLWPLSPLLFQFHVQCGAHTTSCVPFKQAEYQVKCICDTT